MKITPLIVPGFLAVLLTSCGADLCGNNQIDRIPGPDGQSELVVFVRNCGATTGFSTHVSLLDRSEALGDATGNVFVGDSDRGAAPTDEGNSLRLHIDWTDDRTVKIAHSRLARVFKSEAEVNDITIRFESL